MAQAQLGDALLDAAVRCFDVQGWTGTSVERAASLAKIPIAEALDRFPSREHLAVGIFDHVLRRMPEEMSDEVAVDAPLDARLYFILAHELRLLEPHKAFVQRAIADTFNPLSPTGLLQMTTVQRYIGFVSEQIQGARSRGEVNTLALPNVAAWNFWLLRGQVMAFWFLDSSDGSERTHAQADAWVRLFARSLNIGITDLAMSFLNMVTSSAGRLQARLSIPTPVTRRRAARAAATTKRSPRARKAARGGARTPRRTAR